MKPTLRKISILMASGSRSVDESGTCAAFGIDFPEPLKLIVQQADALIAFLELQRHLIGFLFESRNLIVEDRRIGSKLHRVVLELRDLIL